MEKFTVYGKPQGKARARTFYNKKIGRTQSITPGKTVLYENLIKQSFLENCKTKYFNDEPLKMTIKAYFEIPKSTANKTKDKMISGELRPTKKPDIDNICKVICDGLNGIAYGDDKQIVELVAKKIYTTAKQQEPLVLVQIELAEGVTNNDEE